MCSCLTVLFGCQTTDDRPEESTAEAPAPRPLLAAKDDSYYFGEYQSSVSRDQVCQDRHAECESVCRSTYRNVIERLFPFLNACTRQCREDEQTCIQRANIIHGTEAAHGSISWGEPDAEGIGGYFGFCGPTAAANLVANMCGQTVSPRTFASQSFSWGPGTTPQRLANALNSLGQCGTWAQCQTTADGRDPLAQMAERLPVGVLVTWSARSLHWVTVVEVTQGPACTIRFNHQGRQDRLSCDAFLELWSLGETLAGRVAVATGILKPFTFVCQVAE
ncbi:MAG: hypothetical protein VX589_05750 [Myxococcota bacterium]|nr:hypothetical protein [Myxococcota bacterium]